MDDKRIRYLVIAVLLVVLALGLLSLVSTVFQLIIPLALVAVGGFAFYKIVLEGRDNSEAMEDEVAESTGAAIDALLSAEELGDDEIAADEDEVEARERLSAVERAQTEFFETTTPAEDILEQIKARRQRLGGDEEA